MALCKVLGLLHTDHSYQLEEVEIVMRNEFFSKKVATDLNHFIEKIGNHLKRDFKHIGRERVLFLIVQLKEIKMKLEVEAKFLSERNLHIRRKKKKRKSGSRNISKMAAAHTGNAQLFWESREEILKFKHAMTTQTDFALGVDYKEKSYGCKMGVKVRSEDFYSPKCATKKKRGSELFINWTFRIERREEFERMRKILKNCARMCIEMNPKSVDKPTFTNITHQDVETARIQLEKDKQKADDNDTQM